MRRTNYHGYQIEYRCGSWCAPSIGLGGWTRLEDLQEEIDAHVEYEVQERQSIFLTNEQFVRVLESV